MTQRAGGRPQASISMRFPNEALDYLDALVDYKNSQEPEGGRRWFRADVIAWLLSKTTAPAAPSNPLERHLRDTYRLAFGANTQNPGGS